MFFHTTSEDQRFTCLFFYTYFLLTRAWIVRDMLIKPTLFAKLFFWFTILTFCRFSQFWRDTDNPTSTNFYLKYFIYPYKSFGITSLEICAQEDHLLPHLEVYGIKPQKCQFVLFAKQSKISAFWVSRWNQHVLLIDLETR